MTRLIRSTTCAHPGLLIALVVFATPVTAQPLPKKQLVEEARLDATTEDFPDVSTVMVGLRGEMAVVVGKDQQFRFYDPSGKKLGTFGRVGSGPGEFRQVTSAGWNADTLWIYDSGQRRLTYVTPDLKLLRTEVISPSLYQMDSPNRANAADGVILYFVPRAIVGGKYVGGAGVVAGKTPEGKQDTKSKILAIPRDIAATTERSGQLTPASDSVGGGPRTFLAPDPPISPPSMRWMYPDGRGYASMVVPFTFSPQTVYSTEGGRIGFLSVEPGEAGGAYTLRVMTTAGKPVFTRSYPYAGIAIPRSVADSVSENIGARTNSTANFPPEAVAKFKGEVKTRMPKFYSPVSLLHMNRDNTAWIQMRRSNPQATAAVILIDERGNQVATFALPPRTRIVQATRDQIWAVVTGEDDLPSVVRFRVK